ncbi:hypothetical protein ACFU98_30030 [Streptomyces sp. NPDC057575]|uniref:hypothetical protein n=1 Tax=unclassified Streptomyces TaxID=2593676 RepID=UPI0036B2720C
MHDYEFRGSVSPSGRVSGSWRPNPNPPIFRAILFILAIGIPICLIVFLMSANGSLGTGEPEDPKELPSDFTGLWTAKAKLPGEEREAVVTLRVPTRTEDESRLEFGEANCSARMKQFSILESGVRFYVFPTEQAGRPKWCEGLNDAWVEGDWEWVDGTNEKKKVSDKVTLTVEGGSVAFKDLVLTRSKRP